MISQPLKQRIGERVIQLDRENVGIRIEIAAFIDTVCLICRSCIEFDHSPAVTRGMRREQLFIKAHHQDWPLR